MNYKTVSITSYEMINPKLAKVVIAYTGKPSKAEIRAALSKKFQFHAAPVENSFMKLTNDSSVGFVRVHREVRAASKEEIRANYRVMSASSNILMDNKDQSLWEVRNGAGGQFLARHGHEDLSELIEANTYHGRTDVPRVSQLTIAKAKPTELAAYVTPNGDMDYGIVLKTNDTKCQVLSMATRTVSVVPNKLVASFDPIKIPREIHTETVKHLKAAMNQRNKATEIDYWRTLFSYNPQYAEEMVRCVQEDTMA